MNESPKLRFTAEAVEVEINELNILFVGFYAEENYLMIQKSLAETPDRETAMNDYHIERDDQSYGGYGGVERIRLERERAEIRLDETGRQNLECAGLTVDFDTDDETFERLAEKLEFIFGAALIIE